MSENNEVSEYLENTHPGVMMKEDFLDPHHITAYKLAKATKLSQSHVSDLLKGKRNITHETAVRIGEALGMPAEFWIRLQWRYDLIEVRRRRALQSIVVERLIEPTPAIAS